MQAYTYQSLININEIKNVLVKHQIIHLQSKMIFKLHIL